MIFTIWNGEENENNVEGERGLVRQRQNITEFIPLWTIENLQQTLLTEQLAFLTGCLLVAGDVC